MENWANVHEGTMGKLVLWPCSCCCWCWAGYWEPWPTSWLSAQTLAPPKVRRQWKIVGVSISAAASDTQTRGAVRWYTLNVANAIFPWWLVGSAGTRTVDPSIVSDGVKSIMASALPDGSGPPQQNDAPHHATKTALQQQHRHDKELKGSNSPQPNSIWHG